jgi:hypothetical protein
MYFIYHLFFVFGVVDYLAHWISIETNLLQIDFGDVIMFRIISLCATWKCKNLNIQGCNVVCCCVWALDVVSHIKGGTYIEGVREQGSEKSA